jgi:hypothetical protein
MSKLKINRTATCVAIACLCIALLSNADGDGKKRWSENDKLTWRDFKDTLITGTHRAALTTSGMLVNFHQAGPDSLIITAYSQMDPAKSWVNTSREKSDYILEHEQYHFNISEYWCRKFKKDVSMTRFTAKTVKEKIQMLQRESRTACLEMEVEYDKDTNHSEIRDAQHKWERRIDELLKSLEQYSAPVMSVPLK